MKTKSIIAVSCFLLLLSIFSCTSPKSKLAEYGPVLENVMQSDAGAFRGFSLGEAFDTIQKTEKVPPIESDEDYLYYEYPIDTLGTYNIAYNFEEKALNEIQSDIFINNSSKTEEVYNSFKKSRSSTFETVSENYLSQWEFSYLFNKTDKKALRAIIESK